MVRGVSSIVEAAANIAGDPVNALLCYVYE